MNSLSLVIPVYNERENVGPLLKQIHLAFRDFAHPWELILIDDGSADDTLDQLRKGQAEYGDHVQVIALQRNYGQTAAMQAGIDYAHGDVIATLDGDLQNDPSDVPRMVERLIDEDLDVLAGWRRERKDSLVRRIPSWLANRFIARITGVRLKDYGCTLKVYRARVIKSVRLYGEMHRFIPAWAAIATCPTRIGEEVVKHHPRRLGRSKYGFSRSHRVLLDLLSVYFFLRFRSRPGHFFGAIGIMFGIVGGLILAYLAVVKFYLGEDIGTRPLLLVGVLFVISSFQFLTAGITAELLVRTYFESAGAKSYIVRQVFPAERSDDSLWYRSKDQD